MKPGALLSSVPGTTLTAHINHIWYWYHSSTDKFFFIGQVGARQRLFILVGPRGSEHIVAQSIDATNLSPSEDWPTSYLRDGPRYSMALPDTTRGGRGLILCRVGRPIVTCIVLPCAVFSMKTILRTRRDVTNNTIITLIKTYVSNPSPWATYRHPDDGSISYLRCRPLDWMALPDTKGSDCWLIICRGGRPIVTCIVLLCAPFSLDNDTTFTTRCDVD